MTENETIFMKMSYVLLGGFFDLNVPKKYSFTHFNFADKPEISHSFRNGMPSKHSYPSASQPEFECVGVGNLFIAVV